MEKENDVQAKEVLDGAQSSSTLPSYGKEKADSHEAVENSNMKEDGWMSLPRAHDVTSSAGVAMSALSIYPVKRRIGILQSRLKDLRIREAEDSCSGRSEAPKLHEHPPADRTQCVLPNGGM